MFSSHGAEVVGQDELLKEMRDAVDACPQTLTTSLREGSEMLKSQVARNAPQKTGKLASSFTVISNERSAGVRSNLPYAGVIDLAREYLRARKHSGGESVNTSKALGRGRYHSSKLGIKPLNYVHVNLKGETPRFAYRALTELSARLQDLADTAMQKVMSCHGWLDG